MIDPKVLRLKTAEDCESFAQNVETAYPELAKQARRRGLELKAAQKSVQTDVERAALVAVYALEEVRSRGARRLWRANRTWQSIGKNGILATVEYCVKKPRDHDGHSILAKAGMADLSFEAVVLKYPDQFSPALVEKAKLRFPSIQPQ